MGTDRFQYRQTRSNGWRLSTPLRILHLVGSPTSTFFCDLSELYARGCIDALTDTSTYAFFIAHVGPSGRWCFPDSLAADAIAAAPTLSLVEAMAAIVALRIDAAIPQMFCQRGMTDLRALLDLLQIPYLGNRPAVMALAANKAMAKAIVAAAGVDVPRAQLCHRGEAPAFALPAVVKPNASDNSDGLTLVRESADFASAMDAAFAYCDAVLVEEYIELGREVRCGVVARGASIVCLPLEEYFVDSTERPIRRSIDKLKRSGDGDLTLAAKTRSESWIVPGDDPIVPAVWAAARRCYVALGSRHYNLFDFRVDPNGRPWFLEAGPYCSFSPKSVIVTMMEAAGTPLDRFFADALSELLATS